MTDNPGNGGKRFDDLVVRVDKLDGKLDQHSESLAEIKALLKVRPCVAHETRLRVVEQQAGVLMSGAQVSVAKVSGLALVVAGIVSAIGAWFMNR